MGNEGARLDVAIAPFGAGLQIRGGGSHVLSRRALEHRFFLGMAAVMTLVVIVGFARSFFLAAKHSLTGTMKMLKRGLLGILMTALAACQVASPGGSPDEEAAVRKSTQRFLNAHSLKDWSAVAATYTEDAVLHPPNAVPVKGRDAIRDWFEENEKHTSLELETVEVDIRGDLAYVWGLSRISIEEPGTEPVILSGKYLDIRRRQDNGDWLISVDMFSPSEELDAATAAGPAEPYVQSWEEGELLVDSKGRKTFIKVSPETGAQSLAFFIQQMPSGSGIKVHRHDRAEEVLFVHEGSGTFIVGDGRVPVEKGATVFVPPGVWHGFENPDEPADLAFVVTPTGLEGFFRELFWREGEAPKVFTSAEIEEIERKHGQPSR